MAYIPGMEDKRSLQSIPDDDLLRRLGELIGSFRRVEADVVAHIAEVDERGLYAREAFPSMFAYCRGVLHLSEPEAYLRITVARASREHPMLLTMLADGRLHLTAIGLLAPHLTRENRDGLLERATHRSKRQIEELIAEIAPRPDAPAVVRRLPERRTPATAGPLVTQESGVGPMLDLDPAPMVEVLRPDGVPAPAPPALCSQDSIRRDSSGTPAPAGGTLPSPTSAPVFASRVSPSVLQPLSPGRYKVQFTASTEFRQKLERLRALVGSRGLDGDLAAIIEQAVTEKLERLEARRFARSKAPRKDPAAIASPTTPKATPDPSPSSRHIPAAVRRAVYQRDGGRCRYVDERGGRCPERDRLEYHHRHPFGLGGKHSVANLALMCSAHNAYLAACDYGREAMARHRPPRGRPSPSPAG
jgi:5-methylcytosine-specific restriction endonuclease McrA